MPSASAVFGSAKAVANAKGRAAADSPVTAVAISGCGHFGVCGSEDGRLFRYAMQSGLFRGEFVDKSTEVQWSARVNQYHQ
jgi:hypothetical protein